MSVDTVKVVAERFLKNKKPEVLALKGAWGVGKTYTWDHIVKSLKDTAGLKHYCYVSLFGVSSISQLALLIFTTTREIKLIDTKLNWGVINENWFSLSKAGVKTITRLAKSADFPYSKNLSVGLDQLAPSLINETIICLDDFERSQLKAEDVMGFISCLKEEKGCKVVLIFNHEKLEEKEKIYEEYREKVIDIELLFAPSSSEAIGWAFPKEMPWRDLAQKHAENLQIVNIRLLRKIAELIELLKPEMETLHKGVAKQAISTLVLLVWSYYDRNKNKPDFSFLRKWNGLSLGLAKKHEANDPIILRWEAILRQYGFFHTDEFDEAISKVIENGYIEETGFTEEAAKLNTKLNARDLEQSFTDAWKLFYNYFGDNTNELILSLDESFKKSCMHISPDELNRTVRLFRQLGRDDLSNHIIDYYIEKRGHTPQLFDLDNLMVPFSGIDDSLLRARFKTAFLTARQLPTLLDAVMSIVERHSWSKEQIDIVEHATEDDYYQLFMDNQGDKLLTVVAACLWFESVSGFQHLAQKPKAALKRIGSESDLNALRVQRYGVTIDQPIAQSARAATSEE